MADAYQEIELTLGGKTYSVRPEFKIICKIEAAMGRSVRQIGRDFVNSNASITDTAMVLAILLKDRKGPSFDEIGEILIAEGSIDLSPPIGTFFLDAIRGTKAHERTAKAAATPANPPKEEGST